MNIASHWLDAAAALAAGAPRGEVLGRFRHLETGYVEDRLREARLAIAAKARAAAPPEPPPAQTTLSLPPRKKR